jgi:DNA-directed RNA polymerase specialized sigma24 family protein
MTAQRELLRQIVSVRSRAYAHLLRLGLSPADSDDSAQDIALSLLKRRQALEDLHEDALLIKYAAGAARKRAQDLRRVRARREARERAWHADADPPDEPLELLERMRHARKARDELSHLPKDMVSLLELSWMNVKQSEIAAIARLPLGTVKSKIRRAHQALRRAMEEEF